MGVYPNERLNTRHKQDAREDRERLACKTDIFKTLIPLIAHLFVLHSLSALICTSSYSSSISDAV